MTAHFPDPAPEWAQLSAGGRRAAARQDWVEVQACAAQLLRLDPGRAEGHFLRGLVEKAARRGATAAEAFAQALRCEPKRYDAAIELALQCVPLQRHAEAKSLLEQYASQLGNSPMYLSLAGTTYTMLGFHDRAWSMHQQASALQPEVDLFKSQLAGASVYVGKIADARSLYLDLLSRHPGHQRHHYSLANLERAKDARHVEQMQQHLEQAGLPPEKNIFLYYALGKELEDLQRWDESFKYYQLAGDTISRMSRYDVSQDIAVIDQICASCTAQWLAAEPAVAPAAPTPIFIVGLPRSGTTLTERIVSSHSQVGSLDETFFMEKVLHRLSGVQGSPEMTPAVIQAATKVEGLAIARGYREAVAFRLGPEPHFIDKLPGNVLYLGFIAKAFPNARLVHLRRDPMDNCFALYKQSFFKFAYTQVDIARYYRAYRQLMTHWRSVLGDRLLEVDYESLVQDQETQTRELLEKLGLDFEAACLAFERNQAPTATASAAQVREKIHTRSVGRWKPYAAHLAPLQAQLDAAGLLISPA